MAWLALAGLIFWGLVEVLIPNSLFRHVTTHFCQILYLFAVLLLAGGLLFGAAAVWRLGLSVLLVTAVVHGAVVWIGDALAGRRPPAGAVRDLAVCGGVASRSTVACSYSNGSAATRCRAGLERSAAGTWGW